MYNDHAINEKAKQKVHFSKIKPYRMPKIKKIKSKLNIIVGKKN